MRLWPWRRTTTTMQHSGGQVLRWGELGPQGLTFGGAGSLQAPDDLLAELAGLSGARVSRRDALRVTAVLRARNLICGSAATIPLELRNRKRELDERNWIGEQPNPLIETTVHMASTYEDLLFEGKSYWRITVMGSDGYPMEAEHLLVDAVSQSQVLGSPARIISADLPFTPDDPVFVDGLPAALSSVGRARVGDVIRFTSPNPPLLVHAAKAIRTILLLDQIAADYASDPLPFGYFKDASDEDALDDHEILAVLSKWENARKNRRWGYVESGLDLNMLEWPEPQKLQLVEARQHAVLEIARASGLDPTDLSAPPSGSSMTYQNGEQRRNDLIDFVMGPYMSAVQDRLSMGDITPRGLFARYDYSEFTQADFKARMEGTKVAIESKVMEVNEARRRERLPDLPESKLKPPVPVMPAPGNMPPNGNGNQANGNGRQPVGANQ